MTLTIIALLILGAIASNKELLTARERAAQKKNNMIEVPKGTPMPDKQQVLLYHKGNNSHICRFNGFVFMEPLVLLKGESSGSLIEETKTVDSRDVEHRGVYVKLQIAPKVYANEHDAKKEIKAQKFDPLDEIIIPLEQFKNSTYVIVPPDTK